MYYTWLVNNLDWVTCGEFQQVKWQFKEIVDIVCEGNVNSLKWETIYTAYRKKCLRSFKLGYWNK